MVLIVTCMNCKHKFPVYKREAVECPNCGVLVFIEPMKSKYKPDEDEWEKLENEEIRRRIE